MSGFLRGERRLSDTVVSRSVKWRVSRGLRCYKRICTYAPEKLNVTTVPLGAMMLLGVNCNAFPPVAPT